MSAAHAINPVTSGGMNTASSAVPPKYEIPAGHERNTTRKAAASETRGPQVTQKKRIRPEDLSPAVRLQIAELYLEGLITRNQHGMELSAYVVRKMREPGFDEVLIDAAMGITFAECRTELAFYRTSIASLPKLAKDAAKDAAEVI